MVEIVLTCKNRIANYFYNVSIMIRKTNTDANTKPDTDTNNNIRKWN